MNPAIAAILALGAVLGAHGNNPMADDLPGVVTESYGKTADGADVLRHTLTNPQGLTARIITYGATLTELRVPDRGGWSADVVLGFDTLKEYEEHNAYFGATVGRVAFRIAEGRFSLDGRSYQLTRNTPPHHLHGGARGLSKRVWDSVRIPDPRCPGVRLTCTSPDGDEGYPGTLKVEVVYRLTDQNELRIEYAARTDKPTPVNLTHHSYFNLAGAPAGDVLSHVLQLNATRYTPLDEKRLPTGQFAAVQGTPYDFRQPTALGARIQQVLAEAGGYDLSYVLDRQGEGLQRAATLSEPKSGRTMEVWTTEPAIVLYTGNYLDGSIRGKGGTAYRKHAGVCLETAHLPDSVNQKAFPSIIIRPGQEYRHTCVYRFSTR